MTPKHPKHCKRRAAPSKASHGQRQAHASQAAHVVLSATVATTLMMGSSVWAQADTAAATATPSAAASSPEAIKATQALPNVTVKAKADRTPDSKQHYQAVTTSAGKGKQALKDIPQSVTVITEKLMDDKNYDTLKAAMHAVTGIAFEAGEGGAIGDLVRLRGFTMRGDIFLDGMRDIAQYNRDTYNQDRLEVLRGSASMLYGRGSTGGIINQASKQPFLMDQSEVEITAGTHDYYRLTGDFNLKTGENAALRVNVMKTDAHSTRNGPETHRQGIAPTYRWGIGEADEFSVGFYHLSYKDTPDYGFRWLNGRPVDAVAERWYGAKSDYQDDSANYVDLSHLHRFADGSEIKTQFRDGRYKRDLWATTAGFTTATKAIADINDKSVISRGAGPSRGASDHHTFLQTDFNGKANWLGLKHELLAGAEFARERETAWQYSLTGITKANVTYAQSGGTAALADTRVKQPSTSYTSDTYGAYLQDTVTFLPQWKLMTGLRYDVLQGHYVRPTDTLDRQDEELSHRVGLLWQPTESVTYYVSEGSSFNASGDLYQYDPRSANTDPEKSRNYEAGAKWDLFDGDLSMRTAIFRTEKTNERNTDANDVTPTTYLLNGKRHTNGLEFEAAGRVTPQIELTGGIAFMRGTIDKAGSSAASQSSVGKETGLTPKVTANFWATYKLNEHWRFGLGADGMSNRVPASAETSTSRAPGYAKADALIEYQAASYKVKLNLNNLFDKVYVDGVYRGFTVWGPTRNAQLSFNQKF
jgi:catecholate siderophore receptor